jgi:hypothetical protein
MRNKDTPPAADRFTKQVVFDVLPLVPEVLQLPCQCHLGLGKPLTLFVLRIWSKLSPRFHVHAGTAR